MDITKDGIKIVSDGEFLTARMPNGDIIPMQLDLITSNGLNDKGFIHCTVTLRCAIPIADYEVVKHIKADV